MSNDTKKPIRCSFCGKHEQQAQRMIQGPGVQICDECVRLCMSILDDGYEPGNDPAAAGLPEKLPVPREIKEELGLNVVKAKYMSSRYHAKKDVLMLNFIVVVEDRPIKLKEDEIAEARWCTPEEALQLIRKNTTAEYFLINAVKELKKKI